MTAFEPIAHLTRRCLIFPLALVLFELTTYLAHDMIQPGMLLVTHEFHAGAQWVPASLTAYLAGGMVLQWLPGPLSDRLGSRPVMLTGVALFMLICVATFWVQSIEQFVVMRFLQGFSLCFIGAVGYATIQEAFTESLSVKMMALMVNVALLAPLIGPLAGAAFLTVGEWRTLFWLFGGMAAVALAGLWYAMPETTGSRTVSLSPTSLATGYARLLRDRQFMRGALAVGLAIVPCLAWVALSPVMLIDAAKLSRSDYALLQLPLFLAMIAGNLTLSHLADRLPITQPLRLGAWPIIGGLAIAALASAINPHGYLWLIAGLSLYGFGAGLVNAGLYRLTLSASSARKGSVASMLGMISMMIFTLGIEGAKAAYFFIGSVGFSLINLLCGLLWLWLVRHFLHEHQRRAAGNNVSR